MTAAIAFDAKRAYANATGLGNYSRTHIASLAAAYPATEFLALTPKVKPGLGAALDAFPNLRRVEPENAFWRALGPAWRAGGCLPALKRSGATLFHGLSAELPAGLAGAGIRSVATIHDLLYLLRPQDFPAIDRWFYARKTASAVWRADIVAAISQATASDLQSRLGVPGSRIRVLYQDCEPAYKQPLPQVEIQRTLAALGLQQPYLLSVGAFVPRKRQDFLAAAMRLVDPGACLVLAGGGGPGLAAVQAATARHGLQKRVKVLANAPAAAMPALYQGAAAFVYASEAEGFGLPLLEAMHSGLPVMAPPLSCYGEILGQAANFYMPGNEGACAETANALLRSPALHAEAAARSLARAAAFPAASPQDWMALYQSLL